LAAELAASRMATEDAIRRSRVEAEIEADIYATEKLRLRDMQPKWSLGDQESRLKYRPKIV
jgi:hypothetical protein